MATLISIATAANDQEVLERNLLASPDLQEGHQLIVQRGCRSAGQAYNRALGEARHELVAFVHQDVFLPRGWVLDLLEAVAELERREPAWAVLGCYGTSLAGGAAGFLYANGLGCLLGRPEAPVQAQALDEVVLVLRRGGPLAFDAALPGFHLYGTDLCLQARRAGLGCYAINAFCFHNSLPVRGLKADFWRGAEYLRRKWRTSLPVRTPCILLEPGRLGFWRRRLASRVGFLRERGRKGAAVRAADPAAASLGLRPPLGVPR
jgi:hypothetical protein